MDINIVAGKTSELNNEHIFSLLRKRDKSKKHIIIAPDRSLFSLEQRLFEETGESCFFDINVISLTRLSKTLLQNNTNKNILTKQSGVALVKNLLLQEKDNLQTFRKSISYMGFAESLFEMICLYKSCGISPSDVYVDDSTNYFNLKQKDIKLIYEKYEDFLQKDYTDSFNQLNLFASLINKEFCKDTIFYLIEFDDFTSVMYSIIYKLSKFSDGIYISCTYGKENNNSDVYTNKVYYDLIDLYKSNGLNYKINKVSDFKNNTKNYLVNNLLGYGQYDKADCDYIEITEFNNIQDEIKYVIAHLYSLKRNSDLSYSDMAIVVPSLNSYKDILKRELSYYQIPYYIDESEILTNKLLIRNIFSICDILSGDFVPSDFMNLLKSPLFNFNDSKVYDYDNILKRNGAMSFSCVNPKWSDDEDILSLINLILELKDKIKEENSWEYFLNNVVYKILDYINQFFDNYLSKLSPIEVRVFNQIQNKVENINKDFSSVFSKTISNYSDFIDTYKTYFESTTISMPPISSNTLFIADFNNSYVTNYKHIYVLGANEGVLPSFKLDNGLVTDEEINKLPNGNKINPTIAMLNKRRNFKVFELVFKCKEKLHLSYLLNGKDGKQYPNNLVISLLKLLDIQVINGSNILDYISISNKKLNVDNIVFNNLTPIIAMNNLLSNMKVWNVYNDNTNFRKLLTSLYQVNKDKNIDKILSNYNNNGRYNNLKNINLIYKNTTSVSQIEGYYSCPYKHFVNYGLRLKDDIANQFKPNDIGTIIHNVLSKILPYAMDNLDDVDLIISKGKDELTNLLSSKEYSDISGNPKNAYVIKSLYRELERLCVAVVGEIKISNFKPNKKYLEYSFKKGSLVINNINIKGTIDRIDTYNDNFVIIDYKTGDNSFDGYDDVFSGKKLQLLIYAKAFMNESKLNPSGAFYLPLSNGFSESVDGAYKLRGVMEKSDYTIMNMDVNLTSPNYKSNIINLKTTSKGEISKNNYYKFMCIEKDDFHYLLNFAVKKVEDAISNILDGNISPRPLRKGQKITCDFCAYKGLCNYNHQNDFNSVSIESVEELREKGEGDGNI